MLSQLQGRLGRRYIALIAFALVALLLWHGFGTSLRSGRVSLGGGGGSGQYVPSSYDWSQAKVFHPVEDMMAMPAGAPKALPSVQATGLAASQDGIADARKLAVKNAFVKSWEAYKTYAWTKDELMPLSGKGKQSLGGWAVQVVDALDTLWIMGLKDDFYIAVREIAAIDWAKTSDANINVFEVTIRHLGGLLSAYDLSGEEVLLLKAIELGDLLYTAFDTPNRLPTHWLEFSKIRTGDTLADDFMSGAAGGSLCMEFTRLSQITGDDKYYDATERVKQFFWRNREKTRLRGMWPRTMNYRDETVSKNMFTLGAGGDSMYEYLPKMYALLGGLDSQYKEMTIGALETAHEHLLYRPMTPNDNNILMAGNAVIGDKITEFAAEMQHLTCFTGGMYALAGKVFERDDFVSLGSQLASGCVWAYDSFPTNIMPEVAELVRCDKQAGPCPYSHESLPKGRGLPDGFVRVRDPRYLLRPEAIESVFYLWRITGDTAWRDAAWRMWEGIVKETETETAFASIEDVGKHASGKSDSMETFWLGETLKYFYLTFEYDDVISLDDWVLNTEAHPFKRPGRH